ncbi:MAG: ABC transporter ATP-binding protein/permease [Pseudobutyrivibrio sp.]|nr:ABC transporter ATP-binding protein/permease [Pseudobutyrivibrio sp.]
MFKKVSPYVGEYKKYTVLAAFLMVAGVIFSVIPYFLLYQILAPICRHEVLDGSYIFTRVVGVLVCEVLYALLYIKGLCYSHICAFNVLKNLRVALQGKLEKQPLGNIEEIGTGKIKKIFNDDIETIELLLAHAIPEGIANVFVPLLVMIIMFVIDFRLGLLSFIPIIIGMIAMTMMMKSGMGKMDAFYKSAADMNNTIIEYVNGMEVVKVFNKDGESYKSFKDKIISYRDFTLDWYKECWPWMAIYMSFFPCIVMFVMPVGSIMVLHGTITLEKLVLLICMSFAVGPSIMKAMNFGGVIPQLNYKIDELEKLLEHEPLKSNNHKFAGKNLDVEFKDVHFGYDDKEVIHGVNLSFKAGTTTALVGESGSGKSTLAKLLVHYYDLNGGKIMIGGQDISDMSLEELNNKVAYVAQEQFLFNTSLYENILIGNPNATREQVEDAARRAQCQEFLDRLPKGLDSLAGDSGKMLSGGERQRIALARALLKDAPIIVLDEATAFMDPENEEKMNAAIEEIMKDKTVLVIAHRLSTIKNADKICVMKNGICIATDNHEKLIEKCPEYNSLWQSSVSASSWKIGGIA